MPTAGPGFFRQITNWLPPPRWWPLGILSLGMLLSILGAYLEALSGGSSPLSSGRPIHLAGMLCFGVGLLLWHFQHRQKNQSELADCHIELADRQLRVQVVSEGVLSTGDNTSHDTSLEETLQRCRPERIQLAILDGQAIDTPRLEQLAQLPGLRILSLRGAAIDATCIPDFERLEQLEYLLLADHQLTSDQLKELRMTLPSMRLLEPPIELAVLPIRELGRRKEPA